MGRVLVRNIDMLLQMCMCFVRWFNILTACLVRFKQCLVFLAELYVRLPWWNLIADISLDIQKKTSAPISLIFLPAVSLLSMSEYQGFPHQHGGFYRIQYLARTEMQPTFLVIRVSDICSLSCYICRRRIRNRSQGRVLKSIRSNRETLIACSFP